MGARINQCILHDVPLAGLAPRMGEMTVRCHIVGLSARRAATSFRIISGDFILGSSRRTISSNVVRKN